MQEVTTGRNEMNPEDEETGTTTENMIGNTMTNHAANVIHETNENQLISPDAIRKNADALETETSSLAVHPMNPLTYQAAIPRSAVLTPVKTETATSAHAAIAPKLVMEQQLKIIPNLLYLTKQASHVPVGPDENQQVPHKPLIPRIQWI
jgi:hypothetical protein